MSLAVNIFFNHSNQTTVADTWLFLSHRWRFVHCTALHFVNKIHYDIEKLIDIIGVWPDENDWQHRNVFAVLTSGKLPSIFQCNFVKLWKNVSFQENFKQLLKTVLNFFFFRTLMQQNSANLWASRRFQRYQNGHSIMSFYSYKMSLNGSKSSINTLIPMQEWTSMAAEWTSIAKERTSLTPEWTT
jgi:hypothetical protein